MDDSLKFVRQLVAAVTSVNPKLTLLLKTTVVPASVTTLSSSSSSKFSNVDVPSRTGSVTLKCSNQACNISIPIPPGFEQIIFTQNKGQVGQILKNIFESLLRCPKCKKARDNIKLSVPKYLFIRLQKEHSQNYTVDTTIPLSSTHSLQLSVLICSTGDHAIAFRRNKETNSWTEFDNWATQNTTKIVQLEGGIMLCSGLLLIGILYEADANIEISAQEVSKIEITEVKKPVVTAITDGASQIFSSWFTGWTMPAIVSSVFPNWSNWRDSSDEEGSEDEDNETWTSWF